MLIKFYMAINGLYYNYSNIKYLFNVYITI
jgi:hypothetical protein